MKANRRQFFQTMGTGAAGLTLGPAAMSLTASCASPADDGQVLFIGDDIAVAETTNGRVRGYLLRDVYYFLGIPYGADTAGSNRFMPAARPQPWDDIYPALWWGNTAPQNMENRYANKYGSFRDHWNYDDVSENCLAINVFTPGINDGGNRPVIVWMHGGGFTNGNGIEHDGYNGENLARMGDVVFCSLNHRLGPMGFSNLAGVGGEIYASSGNVGVMDLVAALQWVHDNIANFGGDPGNVTIIGQSGGGAKVCTVTSMPSAQGLVHKAVVLSGATTTLGDKDYAEMVGSYILQEAGLSNAQIDRLQEMPWQDYYALANRASSKASQETGRSGMMGGFSPSVDGTIIPQHPYDGVPAPTASNIPMMICSTTNEQSPSWTDSSLESISLDEVVERVRERAGFGAGFGDRAAEVVNAYAQAFPDKKPVEIWSLVSSNRQSVVNLANAKSQQSPPVYVAWFGWQPPLFDDRLRAFHCVDICFWFNNTDLMLSHTGGGARPRALSEKMAGSLLQFMRTGDPNGGGLPEWPRYSAENGETMVLNDTCEVQNDPDREARQSLSA